MCFNYIYHEDDSRTPICTDDRSMVDELDEVHEFILRRYIWDADIPF